mgnify:CR=1 FL=1
MNIGFSLARAALAKKQMNDTSCGRCGLSYSHKTSQCPRCGHLSDRDLQKLAMDQEAAKQANKLLGYWFMLIAAAVVFGGAVVLVLT